MVKSRVSLIIPSRNERFLNKTVEDILTKARGDIEIIVVLEGYWPVPMPKEDPRVVILHNPVATGMRNAINVACDIATGEFLMKLDAHCMLDEGFDLVLKADCDTDWMVVPRRYSLEPEEWTFLENGKAPVDYHYLSFPFHPDKPGGGLHGTVWPEKARRKKDVLLDEEMSSQGSCWFMHRDQWKRIGPMDRKAYGNFVQEFQELGCKTWLGGGKVMVNKKTWYAHLHKGVKYGRGYSLGRGELGRGIAYAVDYWLHNRWQERKHDFSWLIEKFWPVPGWPDNWEEVIKTSKFEYVPHEGRSRDAFRAAAELMKGVKED